METIETNELVKLDEVMNGGVNQRFNDSFRQAMENIYDPNTPAEKERSVILTVTMKPNKDRSAMDFGAVVKTKLVPRESVRTTLLIDKDADDVISVKEITKQIPGQMDMTGHETTPKVTPISQLK